MNLVTKLFLDKKFISYEIKVKDVQFGKYIRSRDPLKELLPITSIADFTPDTAIFFSIEIECDGDEHSYFGNFYVNEKRELSPIFKDEDKTDISPDQIEDGKITERAKEALKTHWDKVWDIVMVALNLLISQMPK